MGKAHRKPSPSMPHWFWLDMDNCWLCKNRRNCNKCGYIRKYAKDRLPKKEKGKHK